MTFFLNISCWETPCSSFRLEMAKENVRDSTIARNVCSLLYRFSLPFTEGFMDWDQETAKTKKQITMQTNNASDMFEENY